MSKCSNCGTTLREGAGFCSACGQAVSKAVFCSNCGIELDAGDKFCFACGAAAKGAAPAAPVATPAAKFTSNHVYGCSEKQGDMVYVDGKGVYYIYNYNLFFLPEGEKKPKNLTRYHNQNSWCMGLNYYNGALWFHRNYTSADGEKDYAELIRYDIETGGKSVFMENLPISGNTDFFHYNRMILRDGLLYFINGGYKGYYLYIINLDSGTLIKRELPRLCNKDMCEEWKAAYRDHLDMGFIFETSPDDVVKFHGLYLHGDYGYIVCNYAAFNIRFRLDDPSEFEFLPFNSCSTFKRKAGMISVYNDDTLIGCGCYEHEMFATTPIDSNCVGKTMKHFSMQTDYADGYHGIYGCENGHGWWRIGNRYFLNHFMIDMDTMKYQKLPFAMFAMDFHEMSDGSVWIYGSHTQDWVHSLYHLPTNCWEKIRMPEELERYRVCDVFD